MVITIEKLLLLVACILFVIAALAFGAVISGVSGWAFVAGGFSAWALAYVFGGVVVHRTP